MTESTLPEPSSQFHLLELKVEDYNRQREYCVALERTRTDLMSVNEELREKIGALERGQEELIKVLVRIRDVPHRTSSGTGSLDNFAAAVQRWASEALGTAPPPLLSPPAQDHSV